MNSDGRQRLRRRETGPPPEVDTQVPASAEVTDLYQHYAAPLRGYARAKLRNGSFDAEDVVQDVFAAYSNIKEKNKISNAGAYLFRMVKNFVYGYNREWQKKNLQHDPFLEEKAENLDEFTPEHLLSVKERHAVLAETIRQLPDRKRRLLVMHRVDGLSYAEIARQTGLPQTTIKRLVAQAVETCRYAVDRADVENMVSRRSG